METDRKTTETVRAYENIADALEEIAITEAGESDNLHVKLVCTFLYTYVMYLRCQGFRVRQGLTILAWPELRELPF